MKEELIDLAGEAWEYNFPHAAWEDGNWVRKSLLALWAPFAALLTAIILIVGAIGIVTRK